ncbi:MAG TPA: hypothetical protein DIC34_00310 [Treponema sp.]|nr:MAG: hypothetical protein A2413_20375 [Treponema sp. RIFOXYC1_FULL_61_9]HCM24989.1 hypothetical protein [Treponema sp.]
MDADKRISEKLVVGTPFDLPVWHWSPSADIPFMTSACIRIQVPCTGWGKGQLGPGLYFSSSAVDCIDRGPYVAHTLLKRERPVRLV